MMELAIFIVVLLTFGFFDIRAMAKAQLKKEIFSYLLLAGVAGAMGAVYFMNPFGESLAHIILDIFNVPR